MKILNEDSQQHEKVSTHANTNVQRRTYAEFIRLVGLTPEEMGLTPRHVKSIKSIYFYEDNSYAPGFVTKDNKWFIMREWPVEVSQEDFFEKLFAFSKEED